MKVLSEEIESLKRREKRYNKDVKFVNAELDRFHATPAFKMAQEHVQENFYESSNGSWAPKEQTDLVKLLAELRGGSKP